MQVSVRDNNVDQALRALKKKLQREGVFREMRLKEHFEKPSEKKARNKAEAIRRSRKLARKKLEREGWFRSYCRSDIFISLADRREDVLVFEPKLTSRS